jgi:hypothetical protein
VTEPTECETQAGSPGRERRDGCRTAINWLMILFFVVPVLILVVVLILRLATR